MKNSLKPGLTYFHRFQISDNKTVPHLYPESDIFLSMPNVFATGFMVGLIEWACVELMKPHLDAGEGSLGVHVDVSHIAATPPGFEVTVTTKLIDVNGRQLTFEVSAHDGIDRISEGRHQRTVVSWDRFKAKVAEKSAKKP